MSEIEQHERVEVFVGLDVGKGTHHAVALDRKGKRLLDSAMPNDESKLRALIGKLKEHGQILLVVDQPATVGALPVAVAQAEGVWVAYLPGLAMRRIADLHAGESKTDARDAYIIAEAARSMPHTLRSMKLADNEVAELTMLCGFDEDLAGQITQTSNRIRGLLTQIHPALERVLGPHLDHHAMLDLLERYPSPAQLAAVSPKQLANRLVKLAPRMGKTWAAEIVQALSEQTVVVLGTQAASIVLPRLARQLAALRVQREEVAKEVERLVLAHPLHPVLTSMPGVGVRTAARLLVDVASRAFASAGHLAAYAGLAPVTRRSGTSIRGELPSRRGNKQLKRAMFLSAFAALRDPLSRAPEALDFSMWPGVDPSALEAGARKRYQRRASDIEEYRRGSALVVIEDKTKVDRRVLYRMINRALRTHPDGRVWDFRALIPGLHTKAYERRLPAKVTGRGLAGAFTQVLERHEELEQLLIRLIRDREVWLVKKGEHFYHPNLSRAHDRFKEASDRWV